MKKILSLAFFAILLTVKTPTVLAGYGSAPGAPVCNNEKPGKPSLNSVIKSNKDEIEVSWGNANRATSWTIAYGKESGKYIYGMTNFGNSNSRSVNINMLPVGTYYFVVKDNMVFMPGYFSQEKKVVVSNNGNILGAKKITTPSKNQTTPTIAPTATSTPTVEPTATPTPTEKIGFFKSIWRFFFGK